MIEHEQRAADGRVLPLSAEPVAVSYGHARAWTLRLPVREERVTVEKQVVVAEEVRLRVSTKERTVVVERPTRRERLRVEVAGDVAATTEHNTR